MPTFGAIADLTQTPPPLSDAERGGGPSAKASPRRGWGEVSLSALAALALLAGCSGARPRRYDVKPVPAKLILREAKAQIGAPYRYGGSDPKKGFDCSGLVWYCYRQHGSATPRTARELFKVGEELRKQDLQPGDLVFFDTDPHGPKPAHVGIYSGGGRFVHAPSSQGRVREDELVNNYWRKAWVGARRIE